MFNFLNLKEVNKESLKTFDEYYFKMYPYLKDYVLKTYLKDKNVLEIGLGFGTLSGLTATIPNVVHTNISTGTILGTSSTIGSGVYTNLSIANLVL